MNFRKIIAVLAAVLMLCTIIPMGAISVSAASKLDNNFDDGTVGKFKADETIVNEGGALKWTTASWKNLYASFSVSANADYKVSFKIKAAASTSMEVKFLNGSWGDSGIAKDTISVSTEWKEYTRIINAGSNNALVLLFQSHKATDVYFDDVKVVDYVVPVDPVFPSDAIYTETFESGTLNGWTSNCSVASTDGLAAIKADGGNYALQFVSTNYSYTNYKLTVEKNQDYKVVFSVLSATSGYPLNARVRDGSGDLGYASYTPSTSAWETHSYLFNSGNNTSVNLRFQAGWETGTYYLDNIYVVPVDLSGISNDGHILNGTFESGDGLGWNVSATSAIVADPTGAGQGYVIKTAETGSAVDMFTQEFKNLVAGKEYTLSFKVYGYASSSANSVFYVRVPKDVTFSNQTGLPVGDSGKTYVARFNLGSNTNAWHTVTMKFVAASSSALIQFQNYRSGQGFYYFDDVALSHAYDAVVTNPTCTTPGATVYTCACGNTYTEAGAAALGHSWIAADCDTAKTCGACGATEGAALGHNWTDATCTAPKTCGTCGATEGEALGHNWTDATCTAPKTCGTCGATEGEALGHDWIAADCDTAKTCGTCGAVEGEALGHNWTDATCTAPKTCGACGATEGEALGHEYTNDFDVNCDVCGAIREVEILIHQGKSASEDVSGLAFMFSVKADGVEKYDYTMNTYKANTGKVMVDGVEYTLKYAGAVVTNQNLAAEEITITNAQNNGNKSIKNIGAKYLWSLDADGFSYAIRVTKIPEANWDSVIIARPYYIYANAEGDSITVYGEVVSSTYNAEISK